MKKIFSILLTAAVTLTAFSQVKVPGYGSSLKTGYGPWICNVGETEVTILWTTKAPCVGWVEIAPDDGTNWYLCERPQFYEVELGRRPATDFHSVRVTGLQKGTVYRYRIFGRELVDTSNPHSEVFGMVANMRPERKVKTLDCSAAKCRFSMVNDLHFGDSQYAQMMEGMPKDNDFILLGGDVVSYCEHRDSILRHVVGPIKEIARNIPFAYVRGNHENRGEGYRWIPRIFPTNNGKLYYVFRQGPVAFLMLDCAEDKPDSDIEYCGTAQFDAFRAQELEWLKEAVKDPLFVSAPQKVAVLHIPLLDKKNVWYGQNWLIQNFTPILNEAGVKLMLSGHHHKYILQKPCDGFNFTTVVNNKFERLDFEADSKSIHMKTYAPDGTLQHSIDL